VLTNIVVSHAPRVKTHESEEGNTAFDKHIKDLWKPERDFWWHELMAEAQENCKLKISIKIFVP